MAKLTDTLFAKYIKERHGQEIIENESGFIIFEVAGPEIFVVDMCIEASERAKGNGANLIDQLAAKFPECTVMSGHLWLKKPGFDNVLAASLKNGFKVRGSDGVKLLILKDLMEE